MKYQCPKCKSESLKVSVEMWARVLQDEDDEDNLETLLIEGDHEWGSDSAMRCFHCNYQSFTQEFQVDEDSLINPVFRVFPEGDVIALWGEPDRKGLVSSYMHVGQHGEASKDLINELKEATEDEAGPLRRELGMIGYRIEESANANQTPVPD